LTIDNGRVEALGPAEKIIENMTRYCDHLVHNRPGIVRRSDTDADLPEWASVTHKVDEETSEKVVFEQKKVAGKTVLTRLGVMTDAGLIVEGGRAVGRYQSPGIFEEIAVHLYRQVADVWAMDNKFAAQWASHVFAQTHRDMKVVLCAFMLVQDRRGDPIREGDEVVFFDDDFRSVGEAMLLHDFKASGKEKPQLLLRVGELLELEGVAAINRSMGFGKSARNAAMGRYKKAVTRWIRYREQNPRLLKGMVKAGFRTTIMKLARKVGYKPSTPEFFQLLRWKQKQSAGGHRTIAIGDEVAAAETWDDLDETAICQKIVSDKPGLKRVMGLLPTGIGLTRAVMAACIDSGLLSNKDLVIMTPTLEELGLLKVREYKERWETACHQAEDMRAANIAKNVKSKEAKEGLQDAADTAIKTAVADVMRGLRVYFFVDKSASMQGAIERAKTLLEKFLQGFPPEQIHIAVFNTHGTEVRLQHPSAAGVRQMFEGHRAGGGTSYGAGVMALANHKPGPEEDSLFFFVGDEQAGVFTREIEASGLRPVAFGLLHISSGMYGDHGSCVKDTAAVMGIPCFGIEEATFEDPYSIVRTLHNLIASTPVGTPGAFGSRPLTPRKTLVEQILETPLLEKPVWAAL